MYQKGDLLWIPAGTLLTRPRVVGKDDLFSNYYQTTSPCVALFVDFVGYKSCEVLMGGTQWTVDIKNVRHNITEEANAS